MIPPPDHPQEAARQAAVNDSGVMEDMNSVEYDQFVTLAVAITGTPMAVFSIIAGDKQLFRAKLGVEAAETPRSVSFCGHTILGEGPLVVENALFDMRFCDNPFVSGEAGVRFYAGIPIRPAADRLPIGSLCVLDRQPRVLEKTQLDSLVALGRLIESHIVSAVRIRRLQLANRELKEMVEKAGRSVFKR